MAKVIVVLDEARLRRQIRGMTYALLTEVVNLAILEAQAAEYKVLETVPMKKARKGRKKAGKRS